MSKGSELPPGCSCSLCLVLGRIRRAAHTPDLPHYELVWLSDKLRLIHSEFLDRAERLASGLSPLWDLPSLPVPVAAGPGGGQGVSAPAAGATPSQPEETPVAEGVATEDKGSKAESEATPEAREDQKEGADLQAVKEEPEDEVDSGPPSTVIVEEAKEPASPPPTRSSSANEGSVKTSEKAEKEQGSGRKRKKRSRSRKSKKRSSKKEKKKKVSPAKEPPAVEETATRPSSSGTTPREGESSGSRRPRSPENPPSRIHLRECHRVHIPAAHHTWQHRGFQRPPGDWGHYKGSKGRVRRERWQDILEHGPDEERKKRREEGR